MSNDAENDRIFKALGHHTRRQILDALRDEPQTTGTLCDAFPELDRCTVMMHLKVLEDADLVVTHRSGRERWIGGYAAHAADRLLQLQRGLEG